MKKYTRPVMEASIINDVNEPVFLLESGWIPSSCYDIIVRTHQGPHLGQEDIRMHSYRDHRNSCCCISRNAVWLRNRCQKTRQNSRRSFSWNNISE